MGGGGGGGGVAFVVLVRENDPDAVARLALTYGLETKHIVRVKARNEDLMVVTMRHVVAGGGGGVVNARGGGAEG